MSAHSHTHSGSETVASARHSWSSVSELLKATRPSEPVYCVYPHVYRKTTAAFIAGFPGRVLYAVKANADPQVLDLLVEGGIRHFDCASIPEIAAAYRACPEGTAYFMVPTRIRGAARQAQEEFGVRHFLVDHPAGIEILAGEIDLRRAVVFARLAIHHKSALLDLSVRFGAEPDDIPPLLEEIRRRGAEPALAFNVGSSVIDPDAYRYAMGLARDVLERLPFKIRLLDVGGGYPKRYPGFDVPGLDAYFDALRESATSLPLADGAEMLGEPGRALAAHGMSGIAEVCLRKEDRLFLNDGMYGAYWELRFEGHNRFPVRAYRDGQVLKGDTMPFVLNGPTCDPTDTLPGPVDLPRDIREGDHLEFGGIGAYSLSGRTDFNGYFSDHIVTISSAREFPPD